MASTRTSRLRRFALSLIPSLIIGGLVVINPSPALAADRIEVPCPSWAPPRIEGMYVEPHTVLNSQPGFLASESRIVVNDLDTPVTATFTSQTAMTFTIAATLNVTFTGLFHFLNVGVSTTITSSTTTTTGVSAQAAVPPHSRMLGDFGVETYEVDFIGYGVFRNHADPRCFVHADTMGNEQFHATAPTGNQGWRLRLG